MPDIYKFTMCIFFSFELPSSLRSLCCRMSATRKGPGAALAGDSYIIPDSLFENIDDGSTWDYAVSRLSDVLKLPGEMFSSLCTYMRQPESFTIRLPLLDMTTRHGLKKVHARFPEIYKKLNAAYNAGKRERNEKIMGAVVGMMAKMCADAILRNKLFEKGELANALACLSRQHELLTRHNL